MEDVKVKSIWSFRRLLLNKGYEVPSTTEWYSYLFKLQREGLLKFRNGWVFYTNLSSDNAEIFFNFFLMKKLDFSLKILYNNIKEDL